VDRVNQCIEQVSVSDSLVRERERERERERVRETGVLDLKVSE